VSSHETDQQTEDEEIAPANQGRCLFPRARGPLALFFSVILLAVASAFAQQQRGTIDLQVQDPNGGPLVATVQLSSAVNQVSRTFETGQDGKYQATNLPFGVYQVSVSKEGFNSAQKVVEVHSAVPIEVSITLPLATVTSSVRVSATPTTLIDTESVQSSVLVGSKNLQMQIPAQLGHGITNAVVHQEPGWIYEANGVLHPRGSEYDVLYVVDGIPITENLSSAFAPPISSSDVQSIRAMTAGFPAEYGRKLGGIVEVTTKQNLPAGLHMSGGIGGGSFNTLDGHLNLGYAHGKNQFVATSSAGLSDRYLDPPVLANYTNHGSMNSFTGLYTRDISQNKRLQLSFRRGEVHYLVPNELVQQQAGQRQDVGTEDTSAQFDYTQVLSPTLLYNVEGSFTDESFRLASNDLATPVIISQQRGYRQGYIRATVSGTHGNQDWKAGTDLIVNPVHEALQYTITNPSQFDPGTARNFAFSDHHYDIEPAAFAQDSLHLGNWNVRAGIRYDRYDFVVNEGAWSPRFAISYYFPHPGVLVHFDYDRIFQTPAMENLLLASSPQLQSTSPLVARLPVRPAHANYYEVGLTAAFWHQLRFQADGFYREFRNSSDDDTLLDTGVSFPIAFAHAWIQGVEGMLTLPQWGRFSGSLSYAWQYGTAKGPITGGLFIGASDVSGVTDTSSFPDSQDQRNTGNANFRMQVTKRLWVATEEWYGSGLPSELSSNDTYANLLPNYGPQVLSQVDFVHQRVRPSYSIDLSAGYELYDKERKTVGIQVQGTNLTNHLNVIDFASLFSGTAIGNPRSYSAELTFGF
jgi:hypothetical protein